MQVRARVVLVDVLADLQAAVDATPVGGTLYLGAGTFTVPSGGLQITKSIAIEGVSQPSDFNVTYADATRLRMGTVIRSYADAANQPVIVLNPASAVSGQSNLSVRLNNLVIDGRATQARSGSYGIYSLRADGEKMETCELDNVVVIETGATGIHLGQAASVTLDSAIVGLFCRRVFVHSCYGRGFYAKDVTQASFRDSIFMLNKKTGMYLNGVGVSFDNCGWESNGRLQDTDDAASPSNLDVYAQAQCYLYGCNHVTMRGHHFENFDGAARSGVAYNSANDYFSRIGLYITTCNAVDIASGGLFYNTAFDGMTADLWRNWSRHPDGTSSGGDESTNVGIKFFQTRHVNVGTQWFRHCYVGVQGAPQGGGADHHFVPGNILNQEVYDNDGYGCAYPLWAVSGSRLLAMAPTMAEALPPEDGSFIGPVRPTQASNSGGIMYWDNTNKRIRVWDGTDWNTLDMTVDP